MAKTWSVTVPIAGHAWIEVEAENAEEAIEKAVRTVTLQHLDSFEALCHFIEGDLCSCPQPWEAEATEVNN